MPEETKGLSDKIAARIIELLARVEPLKHMARAGWVDRDVSLPESVAAHSWRLALMSWLVADAAGLDADKALRIALVHDIAEAVTGDTTPFDHLGVSTEERLALARQPPPFEQWRGSRQRHSKLQAEEEALETLTHGLSDASTTQIKSAWSDYATHASPEATMVHELDKIEAYLQGTQYGSDGRLTDTTTLESFRAELTHTVKTDVGRQLVRATRAWEGSQ